MILDPRILRLAPVAVGCLAAAVILLITQRGINLDTDSVGYVQITRQMLAGDVAQTIRSTKRWPPGYMLTLAGMSVPGKDVLRSARLLNVLCAAGSALVIALLVRLVLAAQYGTRTAAAGAVIAAGFFISSDAVLFLHSMVMTEAFYLLFSLTGILLLVRYLVNPRLRLLVPSALCVAAGIMIRYAGAYQPAACCLSVLLVANAPWKVRVRDALLMGVVSVAPVLLYQLLTRVGTDATLAYHAPARESLLQFFQTVGGWFLPYRLVNPWTGFAGFTLIVFILGAALVLGVRELRGQNLGGAGRAQPVALTTLVLHFAAYLAFVLVSVTFMDRNTPLDSRILLPAEVLLLIIVPLTAAFALHHRHAWYVYPAVGALFMLLPVHMFRGYRTALHLAANGTGITSRAWQESATIAFLRTLPGEQRLVSNKPEVIELLAPRCCASVPSERVEFTARRNPQFAVEVRALGNELQAGALLVWFTTTRRWYQMTLPDLEAVVPLRTVRSFPEAVVYGSALRAPNG